MAMAVTSSMTLTVGSSLKVSLPLPLPHPLSPPQLLNPKRTYPLLSTRRASFPVTEAKIYRDSKHYLVVNINLILLALSAIRMCRNFSLCLSLSLLL